jgi:hypothetical protein
MSGQFAFTVLPPLRFIRSVTAPKCDGILRDVAPNTLVTPSDHSPKSNCRLWSGLELRVGSRAYSGLSLNQDTATFGGRILLTVYARRALAGENRVSRASPLDSHGRLRRGSMRQPVLTRLCRGSGPKAVLGERRDVEPRAPRRSLLTLAVL